MQDLEETALTLSSITLDHYKQYDIPGLLYVNTYRMLHNFYDVMVEAKHYIKIIEADKPLRIKKEISEIVKNTLGGKMVQKMKRQYVDCPVAGKRVPFLECYLCVSFIRRVRGQVHCAGIEYRVRHE